jgi:hypothetical protein
MRGLMRAMAPLVLAFFAHQIGGFFGAWFAAYASMLWTQCYGQLYHFVDY